jgi:hypothetical protein
MAEEVTADLFDVDDRPTLVLSHQQEQDRS